MHLINGIVDSVIPSDDRGLQYGDGCFTTARVRDGKICDFQDHLQRLTRDCYRLAIPFEDWSVLADEMQQLALGHSAAVLKVIITRGSGGRGYSSDGCHLPMRIVSLAPYPQHYTQWQQRGIRLALSPIRLGMNPALAGIKHLNRLEQILIKQQLATTSAEEALVLDYAGNINECSAANIFWRHQQRIYTPLLSHSGVEGTMKSRIMATLINEGYQCLQVTEGVECLANAEEVFICNALMPVVPVIQIEQWSYHSTEIVTKLIQRGFTAS